MHNSDTELLFPLRVTPVLENLRGKEWQKIVQQVLAPDVSDETKLAFVLMMVKMNGCAGCNADSFKAMKGCTMCSKQTVRRFRGTDDDLVNQYKHSSDEVQRYLKKN
ncbi:MAG: hypothetical protein ABFD29_03525 [Anaerolineaceae bacterium]|jgi:radical SAM superfamily enzyme